MQDFFYRMHTVQQTPPPQDNHFVRLKNINWRPNQEAQTENLYKENYLWKKSTEKLQKFLKRHKKSFIGCGYSERHVSISDSMNLKSLFSFLFMLSVFHQGPLYTCPNQKIHKNEHFSKRWGEGIFWSIFQKKGFYGVNAKYSSPSQIWSLGLSNFVTFLILNNCHNTKFNCN